MQPYEGYHQGYNKKEVWRRARSPSCRNQALMRHHTELQAVIYNREIGVCFRHLGTRWLIWWHPRPLVLSEQDSALMHNTLAHQKCSISESICRSSFGSVLTP